MTELPFVTIDWKDNTVVLLDQRRLPTEEVYLTCRSVLELAEAIKTLAVRGAPALGVAGALGVALGAIHSTHSDVKAFLQEIDTMCAILIATRPTAVNLAWAIERMRKYAHAHARLSVSQLKTALRDEALAILRCDIEMNDQLCKHGAVLIDDGDTVLTHCNAGALACARRGSALGVLYTAWEAGKRFQVIADETRPVLQGARLTAWELQKFGIPTTLIADNMAGALMAQGLITKVIVGADRIAANGDVANKIGTYSVAILSKYHDIPFYVAAPSSTIDAKIPHGKKIPIEERPREEITHLFGRQLSPDGIGVRNPAFDVTPATLVSAIITEDGVFRYPFSF